MQDDEQDDLLEELREKLELLEEKIDELENLSDTDDISPEVEADILTAKLEGEVPFHVHWIFADDLDYGCSSVDTVVKAQNLFLEKSYEFDADSSKPRVRHGDLFVLMCSHASTSPKDSQNPSLGDKFDDACYYVGMMVDGTAPDQTIPDLPFHPQIGATGVGMTDRKILVWDSCGSSEDCPDDAEAIQIDEVIIPTSGSSPEKGLLVKSQGYRTKLADLTDFQSINFVDNSSASSTTHGLYGADPASVKPKGNAGILYNLKSLQTKDSAFDVTGTSTKVSLFSTPTTLKETNYEAVTIESKKVSISSDKCGSLSKVSLYGGNSIDVLKSVSGSSNEYDIGTLEASSPVSGSVSLGRLDIPYVSLGVSLAAGLDYTGDQNTKYLFAPELTDSEGSLIQQAPDRVVSIASNVNFIVSDTASVSIGTDGCKFMSFSWSFLADVYNLTFASGLLVDVQQQSPVHQVYTKKLAICEGAAPTSCLSSINIQIGPIDGLSPSSTNLVAMPYTQTTSPPSQTTAGTAPNCANMYYLGIDETPSGTSDIKTFTYHITPKQAFGVPSGYVTLVQVSYTYITDQYDLIYIKEYIPQQNEAVGEVYPPSLGQFTLNSSSKNNVAFTTNATLTLS